MREGDIRSRPAGCVPLLLPETPVTACHCLCTCHIGPLSHKTSHWTSQRFLLVRRSHPSETSNFAALPDAELLELSEQMMLGTGPVTLCCLCCMCCMCCLTSSILPINPNTPTLEAKNPCWRLKLAGQPGTTYSKGMRGRSLQCTVAVKKQASCRHAALLLAALLRLWPRRVTSPRSQSRCSQGPVISDQLFGQRVRTCKNREAPTRPCPEQGFVFLLVSHSRDSAV